MKPLRKLYTNSHYPLKLVYKDNDGVPIDLTGYSAELMVRKSIFSEPLITKQADIDGPNGTITFTIAPEDTNGILGDESEASFLLGAVLKDQSEQITPLLQTQIEIHENIVRP
jgi:hypothetical protein